MGAQTQMRKAGKRCACPPISGKRKESSMNIRRLLLIVLWALTLALPSGAQAGPALGQDHVDLYAEGALPSAPMGGVSAFATVSVEDMLLEGLESQQDEIDISEFAVRRYSRYVERNEAKSGRKRWCADWAILTRISIKQAM